VLSFLSYVSLIVFSSSQVVWLKASGSSAPQLYLAAILRKVHMLAGPSHLLHPRCSDGARRIQVDGSHGSRHRLFPDNCKHRLGVLLPLPKACTHA